MTSTLKARLREPSTWAGMAMAIGMGQQAWASKDPQAIAAVVAGLAAMFLPEKSTPPAPPVLVDRPQQ